jgi:hypothetical protein
MEFDACIVALESDLVKLEVSEIPKCITLHPGFPSECLSTWSLPMSGPKYRKIDRKKYEVGDNENR